MNKKVICKRNGVRERQRIDNDTAKIISFGLFKWKEIEAHLPLKMQLSFYKLKDRNKGLFVAKCSKSRFSIHFKENNTVLREEKNLQRAFKAAGLCLLGLILCFGET